LRIDSKKLEKKIRAVPGGLCKILTGIFLTLGELQEESFLIVIVEEKDIGNPFQERGLRGMAKKGRGIKGSVDQKDQIKKQGER
jgi:hypothetical protein